MRAIETFLLLVLEAFVQLVETFLALLVLLGARSLTQHFGAGFTRRNIEVIAIQVGFEELEEVVVLLVTQIVQNLTRLGVRGLPV